MSHSFVRFYSNTIVLLGLLLAVACQQKPSSKLTISGNWICQNAVDSVLKYQSIVRSPIPPFELVFWEGRDSLLYRNPFEAALFPYKRLNTAQISFASFVEANMTSTLTFASDSVMQLDKPAFTFRKINPAWCRPSEMKGWETGLESYFYRTLLAGVYEVKQAHLDKTLSDNAVVFADDQSVTGTLRASRCQLVMGGDEAAADLDVFYLWNTDSTYSQYGWKLAGKQLSVYSMKNTSAANEKPYYEHDKLLLVLKKK